MKKVYTRINLRQIILLSAVSAISFSSKSQPPAAAYADPAVGSFYITTLTDVLVDANALLSNTVYKLKLDVFNLDQDPLHVIPDYTCQIRIGLGTKLRLDPAFNLASAALSNYFNWSTGTVSGQVFIYGDVKSPIPPDFQGLLSFNIRAISPSTQGPSTITANYLVTNQNPNYNFSDLFPSNNGASLQYILAAQIPVPVTITKFAAVNRDCNILVNWSTAQEIDVSRYEVEMSKNGIDFYNVATVAAQNSTDYSSVVNLSNASLRNPVLFVRLKSIDIDGSYKYSNVVQVQGNCGGKTTGVVFGYPNPLGRDASFINIGVRDGLFNGVYQLTLSDISGKVYNTRELTLSNASSFRYDLKNVVAPGKYFISLRKTDSGEKALIQFEKL